MTTRPTPRELARRAAAQAAKAARQRATWAIDNAEAGLWLPADAYPYGHTVAAWEARTTDPRAWDRRPVSRVEGIAHDTGAEIIPA